MKQSIPILLYHQISPLPHPKFREFTVTTKAFKEQMKTLEKFKFTPITFGDLLNYKRESITLPSKPVIITFDDILEDAVENSAPILEDCGYKAVFYVPTEYIGKTSRWMLPGLGIEFPLIDIDRLKDLDEKGHDIGSHTITHPHLSTISSEECYKELKGSRKILEEILGHEIRHMAYPFGDYDENVKKIAYETGYYSACTTDEAIANVKDDMFSFARINIGMRDTKLDFIMKLHIAQSPYGLYRKFVSSIKRNTPESVKEFIKARLYKDRVN